MPHLRVVALALLALVGCTQAVTSDEEEGASTSNILATRPERTRGDAGPDADVTTTHRARDRDAGDASTRPIPAPPPSPKGAVTCEDRGFGAEARFCGRSPGTEMILYRCEASDWVEVSHCVTACDVNVSFGKDTCR